MAVFHVFAEADVGDDHEAGQFLFQKTHGLLDDAVASVGAGGFGVFFVGNAKKQNGGDAERVGLCGFADEFVGRELEHARHGLDGAANFAAAADEERQDEARGVELGFAHEPAQGGGGAQSSRPVRGELSDKFHGGEGNGKLKIKKCN
jgi:hypothetical protein